MRVTVETICPVCGKLSWVVVEESDLFAWQSGTLVQDAFPYLTADKREALISGICPDCWEGMFGEEEEEDPENFEDEDWFVDGYDEFECGKFIYDEMAANP